MSNPIRSKAIREIEGIVARINDQFERLARSGLTRREQYNIVVQALRNSGLLSNSVMQ